MTARPARASVLPRLLSKAAAAEYCGLSVGTFLKACTVPPVKIRARVLYDRIALDRWVDTIAGNAPESSPDYWVERAGNGNGRHAPARD